MSRKVRILCLDGGGIRGILPGVILRYLEDQLQNKTKSKRRLADFFELVAGTSTGGILALGYLVPGRDGRTSKYSAAQVVDVYLNKGAEIFAVSTMQQFRSLGALIDEKYKADVLEETLESFFADAELADLRKPCLIPAYDIRSRKTVFFNSTDAKTDIGNFSVRDVARATSAAPTYFEASMIKSKFNVPHALIDGGVFANNPTMCAYAEARSIDFSKVLGNDDFPDKPSAKDMMVLSIGTGSEMTPYPFDEAKDWGQAKWVTPVLDIMMSAASEVADYQIRQMFKTLEPPLNEDYVRLDPKLFDASPDMDNVSASNIKALEEAGLKYVEDNQQKLLEIADRLIALDEFEPEPAD